MEIQGKIAVVTGGASGIGRATAIALAREGADLVLADVNDERLLEVQKEITGLGRKALTARTDVSKHNDVRGLFDLCIEQMGHVDILMNNAGVHMTGPVDKISIGDWEWMININLWGVIHGIHVFLPHMLQRGSGHIVNTASVAGLLGMLDESIPYTTTKFAVVGLSEGLATYVRNKGVGVSVVCPGMVLTDIAEGERFIPAGDGLDPIREKFRDAFKKKDLLQLLQLYTEIFGADSEQEAPSLLRQLGMEFLEADGVAESIVCAIKENTFMVCTHSNTKELLMARAQDIEGLIEQRVQYTEKLENMAKAYLSRQEDPGR